jgi:ribonuclease III
MTSTLEERIGYQFRDAALLERALTHPSLAGRDNNQRLEFLGDAVLGTVVARMLYELYPGEQEGELARRFAALVRGETLASIARAIALGPELKVALSEVQNGGRDNPSNLEDALEALIGAIYLDGGIDSVQNFLLPHMQALAQVVTSPPKDAKTALQEWAQARGHTVPNYTLVETVGLAHAPTFTVEVSVAHFPPQRAQATGKRAAEQAAAALLLQSLTQS